MRSVIISDSELIKGLISGNEVILKEFYRLFFGGTRRYVLLNKGNNEDAKDIFHDTLLVVFQKVREGNFKLTCTLGTYVYSVSKYLWLKELSKRKWVEVSDESDKMEDIDQDIVVINEKNERMLFFYECFEKLSEDCRKVLKYFSEGMSIAEITSTMGYKSEQHTRNRRYRCKQTLVSSVRSSYNDTIMSYGNHQIN
jgi:RNA polymerase sigma factor (sigma-70 family)